MEATINYIKMPKKNYRIFNMMQTYMVELYQDTLVDLLLPKNMKRLKLDIKKDSKVIAISKSDIIFVISKVIAVF